jgi:hypothetical protein
VPSLFPGFMTGTRVTFVIFLVLCLAGARASWRR